MRLAILRRASQAPGVSLRSGRQPLPHERRCLSAAAAALKRDGPGVPVISKEEYAARRRAVLAQMPSHSVAIFPSAQQQYMSEDVPHLFHQNTDLMYLSGCDEPGSVLVLDTTATEDGSETAAGGRSVLFLEPREEERERWDGPMLGVSDETRDALGIDGVAPVSTLPTMLGENLTKQGTDGGAACQRVFYDPSVNESVTGLVGTLPSKESQERFVSCWSRDRMPKHFVSRPRLIKSPAEAEMLRRACSAICGGLNDAMAHCTLLQDGAHLSSVRERTIEAHIEFGSKMRGATRMAFPSVVASGANGTVLHYMKNSDLAKDGDFVMVDAGCIVDGACSDVSRSWPVNGKFSGPQRDMYDLVLDVQLRCIDMAREGIKYRDRPVSMNVVHAFGSKALTEGLKTLGFMKDMSVEQALATGAYHQWFGHSIGHYLGNDVHDTHSLSKDIPLAAGMCVTIEPGLYVRADDESAPAAFRGLGMRIEDDLLVNEDGMAPEIISHEAAKSVEDIEALVGSGDNSAPGGLFARPDSSAPIASVV